jgi:hypothetical protein
VVEPTARFEEVQIRLPEAVTGVGAVNGVVGIPEWWPTGSRVGLVLAHDRNSDLNDPVLVGLQQGLTARGFLSLRFNFPFAQLGRQRPDRDPALERTYYEAAQLLLRDPAAAPAHLFLAGKGIGARTAALTAMARLRVDGLIFLGYPLHRTDRPDPVDAEPLYRIIAPMLFCQGSRDRTCDLDVLRRTLARVGAPKALHVVAEADHGLKVPKKSGRTPEAVLDELLGTLQGWVEKVIGA